MPTNLVDSGTFTSPIVAPTDGDALNAASVVTGLQGLANRTYYNSINVAGLQTRTFGVTATQKKLMLPIAGLIVNTNTRFAQTFAGAPQQTDVTDAGFISTQPVSIPVVGGAIVEFGCYRQGGGGHAGTAPGTKPIVGLKRLNAATGSAVLVASLTDNTSGANWDTAQLMSTTTISNGEVGATSGNYIHYIEMYGEDGANKQTGWVAWGCYVLITA